MRAYVQRFGRNLHGRDIAVGDIHGHFLRLESALAKISFDPRQDRLFSVGDLIDRGPDSIAALEWLSRPWFHAVRGNHEDYAVRYETVDVDNWAINGGAWFQLLSDVQKRQVADAFAALPYAMEIETAAGLVGVVHADCPSVDWQDLATVLMQRRKRVQCIWSRDRITAGDATEVAGVRAVVVGHTPLISPVTLGNVYHIDTGGWTPHGHFSLLNLSTMTVEV
ncbi:serine/threonine protein phosphatase [Pigmentiphaga aceris]|uniref:Serine/threonine protein phosphatase n=1 Tax=Pigmentiphaga aceris TaxID=1940612 RepID=A0A5C0AXG5_9BURK|nr:metallophosphoesterase [Pigmentiphaga aceris]QEI06103.1 serine/threonine protein phosphatase [Pigmentiphaga aceris]